jgi:mediator of RNA polymerase II transcription subunit 6
MYRQQNSLLLTNAMRATALHLQSKTVLSASLAETNVETVPETPASLGVRNSATPAPAPAAKTPAAQTSQEPPSRALPGAGKKKRKRMLRNLVVQYGKY